MLDLKFINPASDITIQHLDASCDTDKKVIQSSGRDQARPHPSLSAAMAKLDGWKMWELDLVIRHPRIGNGVLGRAVPDQPVLSQPSRNRLGRKTTVEQVCALFGDLNTETRFTKLHEKREDALYQNLFLNKRLINPLDPAFQLDPSYRRPARRRYHHRASTVVLAALGIREADLVFLKD